ncbi:metallophosphoesterase [Methylorubrum salsuginis]|uniref:Calcineurin-like phosphoesterase superfamily domain-containing protein n=1 Tax=Methylorubrum salsuginis TaxID=414703 RepID=A0A1I4MJ37_9HYPH|nr:metallophosphoesterase [Methylorubrum salsuginis]SFM03274.1 Calcineurin-like phosphoesterase superfamily domain-containing protein [Methylorubrum salsuginis]
MRAWILSDLHVDACPWEPPPGPRVDLAIVAGDVADGLTRRAIPWLAAHVRPRARHVVYVPGNHDFYGCRLPDEIARGRDAAIAADMTLLDGGQSRVVDGLRIVGATLWTNYAVGQPRWSQAWGMREAGDRERGMRDHRRIQKRDRMGSPAPFRPPAALALHGEQRERIERVLAEPHQGQTVVVTHHAPHPRSLPAGEATGPGDAAYASDLSAILDGEQAPDLWIHGHVHRSVDYRVGRTRVLANPRGHDTSHRRRNGDWIDERENPSFDPLLTLEI